MEIEREEGSTRGLQGAGNGGAGRGGARSRRMAPPRRIVAPPWGSLHRHPWENRWATRGCSVAHPSALLSPQGFAHSRGLCRSAYQPALPPPPPANMIAIRITSASTLNTSFHSVRVFSPALLYADFEELPASLAATATSERHRDQDQGEFQHLAPHRLEVRFLLHV